MITAIDTNVIVARWDPDEKLNFAAQRALDGAVGKGALVISAPVFSELTAVASRTETFVENFLVNTGISADWVLGEPRLAFCGQSLS